MDQLARARLGPIPLPYILFIGLLPLWLFSVGENSLLYYVCVITTTLLKGSLLSRWVTYKCMFPWWLIFESVVIFLVIYVIGEDLQISVLPLVLLVPLSTAIGVAAIQPHLENGGKRTISGVPVSRVIGIFSRESERAYDWLLAALQTSGTVVPFCITNSNFQEFTNQVSRCSLAVLYHSKNRGRLNITDVTDSIYDEEITHMSEVLGREKVMVVVDDLEDSSDGVKDNLLSAMPTILHKTQDVYLFTLEEKQDKERTRQELQPILSVPTWGSLGLSSHLVTHCAPDLVTALVLCAPWIHYSIDVYHGVTLIFSNVCGSILLYNFLLPSIPCGTVLPFTYPIDRPKRKLRGTKKGVPWTGHAPLLLIMGLELLTAYWYHTGMKAIVLAAQSFTIIVCAVMSPSPSSCAAP